MAGPLPSTPAEGAQLHPAAARPATPAAAGIAPPVRARAWAERD